MPLYAVRGDSALTTYFPYNGFILTFQVGADTPANTELRINIYINVEFGAIVLRNSIIENFPAATGKKIICRELNE